MPGARTKAVNHSLFPHGNSLRETGAEAYRYSRYAGKIGEGKRVLGLNESFYLAKQRPLC